MSENGPIADEIDGVPSPAESAGLIGHEHAVSEILKSYKNSRVHHAYLITGPKGIGKATFSLRMAAHFFKFPQPSKSPDSLEPIGVDDPVDSKIAARSHPNLLHLQRPWDAERKRFKQNLTIDEVRKTISFFGTSRAESGWRVCIVDAVDDMNRSASNALLKILEEPPDNTVFFVLAHSPAKVLPTIRSRCQSIALKPLSDEELFSILDRFEFTSGVENADRGLLAELSRGSVRDAIALLEEDGLDLYQRFAAVCEQIGEPDWTSIHALLDMVTGKGAENRFRMLIAFAEQYMETRAAGQLLPETPISVLARWAEVWEKTRNSVRTADAYNLDRRQLVMNLFYDMGEAARA